MYKQRIKEIRTKLNLSVAKMAKEMKIPVRTFASYENEGRTPSLEFVAQLCRTFNVDANWFIFGVGKMFIENKPSLADDELEAKVVEFMKKYGVMEK